MSATSTTSTKTSHGAVTGVRFMLIGAVRSMQSEFKLEGYRLCFVKERALHWNLQQLSAKIPLHEKIDRQSIAW